MWSLVDYIRSDIDRTNVVKKQDSWNTRIKKTIPYRNSLNSSILTVKLRLTFTDKGVLMLHA